MTKEEKMKDELDFVLIDSTHIATIKFFGKLDDSKHIQLTQENVKIIIDYLQERFFGEKR